MAQLEAHFLEPGEHRAVLEHLAKDVRANLMLLDLVTRAAEEPAPGEMRTQIAVASSGSEIAGVAALRPSVVLDAGMGTEALEALVPYFEPLGIGLVKSAAPLVDALWSRLSRRGRRRALVDRCEIAYSVEPATASLSPVDAASARRANRGDLEPLVVAARESLREESRPDPFAGDVRGFRRWVEGRVGRARVVEGESRIVYVGYADVQRPDGWLLQGIYTWPKPAARASVAAVRPRCVARPSSAAPRTSSSPSSRATTPRSACTRASASSPSPDSAPFCSPDA